MKIKSLEIPVRNLARVQEFFKVVLPEFVVSSVDKTLFAAMPEDLEVSFVETSSAIQGTGPILEFQVADAESAYNMALSLGAQCVSLPWFHERGKLSADFTIVAGLAVRLVARVYAKKHLDLIRQKSKLTAIVGWTPSDGECSGTKSAAAL